ncbi:effector-associated domain 2-containing protein [Actinosynnema sp. CS-041913]|uniref:VMAP-C domain-containing protein n=1 Tax=Actinosynnema sp. CS-041913 TaxID=3239917 RepID=UPI003D9194C0
MRTPREPEQEVLWQLVDSLSHIPVLAELHGRNLVVRMLCDELGEVLPIEEQGYRLMHLYDIVVACRQRPLGLSALVRVVGRLDKGSRHMAKVRNAVYDMTVLPYWPFEVRHTVITLLREVHVEDVDEVYRAVAGPTAPQLPPNSDYLDAFSLLETLNARPDGLPKPLVFIEHLAARARPEVALELHRWAGVQGERLGLADELRAVRHDFRDAEAPLRRRRKSDGFLVFSLQRVGATGDRFELVHWRQLGMQDGWYPMRVAEHVGDLESVKHAVAALIVHIEGHWADFDPSYHVEFVLSAEMLNLDVDQWSWETDPEGVPQPLGCRYPVVVRSLERMGKRQWHREWRARWAELAAQLDDDGVVAERSACWGRDGGQAGLRELMAAFDQCPGAVSLVLSSPPRAERPGREQIAVGLRAGVPVVLWHRDKCDGGFVKLARELLHTGDRRGLLERVRLARTVAFAEGPDTAHPAYALTVLYDDPGRMVVPLHPKAPEGASAA